MEHIETESKNAAKVTSSVSTASTCSNQLYIAENLELDFPEDTFRMNLDNFSDIGENVTIGERGNSVDNITLGTPMEVTTSLQTPEIQTPLGKLPIENPTDEIKNESVLKTPTLLKLSLTKNHDHDMFVKPSPVTELMSPARMLQYEIGSSPYTPTMKRAAIDFDFFNKNKFNEYFENDSIENNPINEAGTVETVEDNLPYKETAVIVDSNTVRHEIGDGSSHSFETQANK